jgi:large subunit ribosomal protein L18
MKQLKQRQKRRYRIRKTVSGTALRPRLAVFRSNKYMYVQVIDDINNVTLVYSDDKLHKKGMNRMESAKKLGENVASKCIEKNIKTVVFDRGGYNYHGRVKQVAEGARSKGLIF